MTYCFRTYIGGSLDEHIDYIEAESKKEAIKQLELDYWPDVIDYKFLGIK